MPHSVVDDVLVARGNTVVLLLDDGGDDERTGSGEERFETFTSVGCDAKNPKKEKIRRITTVDVCYIKYRVENKPVELASNKVSSS